MTLNLANALTLFRMALLPVMIVLLFIPAPWAAYTCLALYAVGSFTDWLDGYVARKFNQTTPFGTFLDPISDKIFVMTILLMLIATDRIENGWVLCVIIILVRELVVSGLREFLGPKDVTLPVSKLAKWKTAVQMVATGLLIVAPYLGAGWGAFNFWMTVGKLGLLGAATLTVITGWDYLKASWAHLKP